MIKKDVLTSTTIWDLTDRIEVILEARIKSGDTIIAVSSFETGATLVGVIYYKLKSA